MRHTTRRGLGQPDWPPRPHYIILTDRADGTEWVLHHDTDHLHVGITDTLPGNASEGFIRRYAAGQEPYFGEQPRLRLIVRSGVLGYEYEDPLPEGISDRDLASLLTRRGNDRFAFRLNARTFVNDGDRVAYTDGEYA